MAENERSSYQQYLAGIANLLLGMAMYYHANHQFVSQEVVGQIDRARRIMRDEFSTGISPEEVAAVCTGYSWFRKMYPTTRTSPRPATCQAPAAGGLPSVVRHIAEHQRDRLPNQLRRRLLLLEPLPPSSAHDARRIPDALRLRTRTCRDRRGGGLARIVKTHAMTLINAQKQ